jgi:hypothetical protein
VRPRKGVRYRDLFLSLIDATEMYVSGD